MSDRTNHPPSTEEPPRSKTARRAIAAGAMGVALLIAPVALANVLVPGEDEPDVAARDGAADTSLITAHERASRDHQDRARVGALRAVQTTTTTTAPPTTTTEPPTTTTEPPPTTEPPAPPPTEPPPPSSGGGLGDPYDYASWDALAQCESGGNWAINTGNGYYGGLQFSLGSWQAVGGTGYPHEHSRETQIQMGIRLWERSGSWAPWPACSAQLGFG